MLAEWRCSAELGFPRRSGSLLSCPYTRECGALHSRLLVSLGRTWKAETLYIPSWILDGQQLVGSRAVLGGCTLGRPRVSGSGEYGCWGQRDLSSNLVFLNWS